MEKTKILFISRAYPPIVGGIENQNYELSVWLSKIANVTTVANTRGRFFLPIFAPYALLRALLTLRKYDAVVLGDGTIAIIGWFIKLFSNKPVISVLHGLDINWNSASLGVWYERFLIFIYKSLWIKVFLPKLDKYIAVGNETIRVGVEHGIPEEKFVFIPNGVDSDKHLVEATREHIEQIIKQKIDNKKIILTTGRLAKRKGVAWFIQNVLPQLGEEYLYIVAGSGPDKQNIKTAIKESGMEKQVVMLGYVSDEDRNLLWNSCDLFIQPNIKVAGDMEGFGISVIEAGACRLPVLASNMEGLKDAIKHGCNGFLVESENPAAYVEKIKELFANGSPREEHGESVRNYVVENYHWNQIAQIYLEEINKIVNKQNA